VNFSEAINACSPGSHPHADRPNWRPAETPDDYLRNCREGLETYSERRMAKLLGMTRIGLWRAKIASELPQELFKHILQERRRLGFGISMKSLAQIALALRKANNLAEVERCPHCGEVLRLRPLVGSKLADVVNQWLREQQPQ
jgi:hypothetical protein